MKVLILAYDFPPYVSVGGLRPYNWYKYFRESGVEPIVITRQWSNKHGSGLDYVTPSEFDYVVQENTEYGTIIRTPYRPNLSNRLLLKYGPKKLTVLRKSITAFFEIFQFFLPIGSKYGLYKAAKQYVVDNKVDVIIATGDPFVLFHYASRLSKQFDIPWVADYRDPWSSGLNSVNNSLRNTWNRFQEKRSVSSSAMITTVDELFKFKISEIFPNKKIEIIANGYDPEPFDEAKKIQQNSVELRIAFVGTIYKWHPIRIFLEEFKNFVNKSKPPKIKLVFYGINIESQIQEWIKENQLNIEQFVEIFHRLDNDQLIKKMANDNVMLLFNYYSFTGTKIYDYLAIDRKILFCFSNDPDSTLLKEQFYYKDDFPELRPQEKLIMERNAGIIVEQRTDLVKKLEELYSEFRDKGFIETNSILTGFYSRKNQTKILSEILHKLFHNN